MPSNGRGAAFYEVGGGESGYIASDPTNPNLFYAGAYGGYITSFDRSTNQRRYINVWPEYPVGQSAKDLKERFQWTAPIVLSPLDPKARKFLEGEMENFFFGDGSQKPQGYVPPEA